MKFSIAQRLYFGLIAGFIIVLTIGVLSYLSYQKQIRQSKWVQHTQEVINTTTSVKQLITQIETNKRNIITNPTTQAKMAFDTTVVSLQNTLKQLDSLVEDNPDATAHVQSILDSTNAFIQIWRDINAPKNFDPNNDTLILLQKIRAGSAKTNALVEELERFKQFEHRLFVDRSNKAEKWAQQSIGILLCGLALILIIVGALSYQVYHELVGRLRTQNKLKRSLKNMENLNAETTRQNWQLTSLSKVNNLLQGQYYEDAQQLAGACTSEIAKLLDAPAAILYSFHEEGQLLQPIGTHATPSEIPTHHYLGTGITGQAALAREATVIDTLPEDYPTLSTGIGSAHPKALILLPLWVDDQLIGLLEVIGFKPFTDIHVQLLNLLAHNMAGALQSVISREHLQELVNQISKQKEELETSQEAVKAQSSALEQSNRYKSEFLANMSHELRTPLNSILILANLLSENMGGQLSEKQKEYSQIIHKSGSDLLHLINDILDLSKIESGKIDLFPEEISVDIITQDMDDFFSHVASEREISFSVEFTSPNDPRIYTDKKRIEQILKNLLSNALKFTTAGGTVSLKSYYNSDSDHFKFVVKDTGKGIPDEYQSVIFEAFQQVDGATNRKFGGTGLGLSISRNLAEQLGGSLTLQSTLGVGSEFTLLLPKIGPTAPIQSLEMKQAVTKPMPAPASALVTHQDSVEDDRYALEDGNKLKLLIIEDDENFATILRDFARKKNYNAIVALSGEEGLYCARKFAPSAVLLDIHLPGLSGTEIIYTLKRTPNLSNIPIHVITSHDDLGYLQQEIAGITIKPFEFEQLDSIFQSIAPKSGNLQNAEPTQSKTTEHTLNRLSIQQPREKQQNNPPSSTIDEDLLRIDGCRILLTDDDMRNVYALTAMLEALGADVTAASNGEEALDYLSQENDIELILMDIMMPVMDGYETMQHIRKQEKYQEIPIIAVSAKAMAGDRQKAIDAGATEYLTKPINKTELITLIHSCIPKNRG
ncbi:response regulator [Sphingobacterium corticis]|uniref:histidine kinase n=1 Tax=Sphingobacterium corticis TaxID=1812823 RepID=A0ABW5NJ92_9SPHI